MAYMTCFKIGFQEKENSTADALYSLHQNVVRETREHPEWYLTWVLAFLWILYNLTEIEILVITRSMQLLSLSRIDHG